MSEPLSRHGGIVHPVLEAAPPEQWLSEDLDHILAHTAGLWEVLRGGRIFVTGGTGFVGSWLLESFAWVNTALHLDATAVVLTRDPEAFRRKAPHLAYRPAIQLHAGDVRSFVSPEGTYSHIIHAATDARVNLSAEESLVMLETMLEGTRHTLEFARRCHASRFLFVSSGAVYGKQPPEMERIPEDYAGAPHPMEPAAAYGEGKRAAELLCSLYARHSGLPTVIARGFAFVGPYLPLAAHFAIGNFIRDGLTGGPIHVKGDGTPFRSYLYAADLAIWLWHILFRGQPCRPYNVGSEAALSIADLAEIVAGCCQPLVGVRIATPPTPHQPPERYVPSTQRAQAELGLRQTVDLETSIRKTLQWSRRWSHHDAS